MDLIKTLSERDETADFPRSGYEVVFSVFMVGLAYLYRENPLIAFPEVLYLFMSLLAANFAFNRIVSERARVSIWAVDGMTLANIGIITAILAYSGGPLSYFWVLFLLPIFTAALTGRLPEVIAATALSVLLLGLLSFGPGEAETALVFSYCVKTAVFIFSAFVTYVNSQARRRLEAAMSFKRGQVHRLLTAAANSDSQAQLDAPAAEVGRMTAGLLHDLGNIISIIVMSAEIMTQNETPSPEDAKRVKQAASMARCVIDGALAVVKGARFEFREAGIKEPLENSLAIFNRQARGHGVKLTLSVEEGLPPLRLSVPHVQRVIINAVTNALSFLKAGNILTVSAARDGDFVRVVIEDDGPGFPQEMLVRGITQFGTTRKATGGTGLGLFNSKEIVEKHGGRMAIRNRQPSGAVVEFTLPVPKTA